MDSKLIIFAMELQRLWGEQQSRNYRCSFYHKDTKSQRKQLLGFSLGLRSQSKMMTLIRIAAIAWMAFVVGLSVTKSLGYGAWLWGGIEATLGNNLTMHFLMAGFMPLFCLPAVPECYQRGKVNPVVLVLMMGCAVDELLQYYIPSRNFSAWDAAASCAGVLVFSLPVLFWRKLKN